MIFQAQNRFILERSDGGSNYEYDGDTQRQGLSRKRYAPPRISKGSTRISEQEGAQAQTAALADAKVALRESEDRFLRLMRGAKDYALYMLDASGNVASWNAGAELLEGYQAEEIIGKHLSTFYKPLRDDGHAQENLATADADRQSRRRGLARSQRRLHVLGQRGCLVDPRFIRDPAGIRQDHSRSDRTQETWRNSSTKLVKWTPLVASQPALLTTSTTFCR